MTQNNQQEIVGGIMGLAELTFRGYNGVNYVMVSRTQLLPSLADIK